MPTTGESHTNCLWFYLNEQEDSIPEVHWGGLTVTGAVNFIKEHERTSRIKEKTSSWKKLTKTMNEKLNQEFNPALSNLDKYAKENNKKTILIAWDYRMINSHEPWWKKIIINYDFYYQNKTGLQKYNSHTTEFYYRPDKGTVKLR